MDAWSKRVLTSVVDIPFADFAKDENRKFHRVKYFRMGGEILWEAQSKRHGGGGGGGGGGGSSSPGEFVSYSCSPPTSTSLTRHLGKLSVGREGQREGQEQKMGDQSQGHRNTEDLLPEEAWLLILQELRVKDLCIVCAVSKHLNSIVKGNIYLWKKLYFKTFGIEPESEWSSKVIKHVLCKSERYASKWLDVEPREKFVGFPNTSVLDMNDSHVISADGQNLRVWVPRTDRRIKTLTPSHASNISCIGFSKLQSDSQDTIISSGDVTGHLRLWSMDELKNIRSLRAHADSISDTLHFSSLCITCSLDGFVKIWDTTQAHPLVLELNSHSRIYNMSMHGSCNRLYTVGTDIKGWDLETAQTCLQIQEEDSMIVNPDEFYGYPVDVWPGTGNCSKALASNGNLLASAGRGIVNVYDIRTNERCCSWRVNEKYYHSDVNSACTGLEMDDWKLVCGFKGAGNGICVYDIRAASSCNMKTETVMDLSPKGKTILAFRVEGEQLLAGLEGEQCYLWNFSAEVESTESDDKEDEKQSKQKKKTKRCPKIRKKYPKRTTR